MRQRKPKKTFAQIGAERPRYDPSDGHGYGHPRQWRGDFYERMGFDEAQRILDEETATPREILGVSGSASWSEIVAAYRKKALACHPDRAALNRMTVEQATRAFQRLQAAFSVLAHQFRK